MTIAVWLIPVYNNQSGCLASLESIRVQTASADVVIVDDGSEPPLLISEEAARGLDLTIIRLHPNGGITAALNAGLAHILPAGYDYVARLDAGDTVAPERLALQLRILDEQPGLGLVGSHVTFVDEVGGPLYTLRPPQDQRALMAAMHLNNCLLHPSVTMRVGALRQVGVYDERYTVAEDYELFRRIGSRFQTGIVPRVLTLCQFNVGGISLAQRLLQQKRRLRVQLKYFNPLVVHAWIGVARTIAAMLMPSPLLVLWKRRVRPRLTSA